MQRKKIPLIALVGPTAVGKTALSINLAKHFNCEIISGDSMQVYKYMDIGTAKITPEEMEGVSHHLIDFLEPDEPFNALRFKTMAEEEIIKIHERGHIPFVVGGTGLYVNGLIYDYGFIGERDDGYRKGLEQKINESDREKYYQELMRLRPDLKDSVHENDTFRIARFLEIIKTTGKENLRDFDMKNNYDSPYQLCLIGLNMDRAKLYQRIEKRIDLMLEAGLLEELELILQKGYNEGVQSLKAIGYKELLEYLNGRMSYEEAVELLKKNTRHFAKRQITWFNRDPNIKWFYTDQLSPDALFENVKNYVNECLNLK